MERALNLIKETLSKTFINLLKTEVSNLYLVGGALRDAYYGIPLKDFDFVVSKSDLEGIRDFLKERKISHFSLNEERFLLLRANSNNFTFDFMILDDSIEKDANKRDFTMNALYYDVKSDKSILKGKFLNDLKNRVLNVVNDDSIKLDPIRSLRGIRLACDLSLSIETSTKKFICEGVSLLKNVSKERVREEVKKILHSDFKELVEILKSLFGQDLTGFLPQFNLIEKMDLLDKEVNKDVSFKDLCKISVLVKYFNFFLTGFTGREMQYIEKMVNLKIENNFDSLFEAFFNNTREIRIPLCAIATSFDLRDVLKAFSLFDKWSKIKIDTNAIKKSGLNKREFGEKKKKLLKIECKKVYEEI